MDDRDARDAPPPSLAAAVAGDGRRALRAAALGAAALVAVEVPVTLALAPGSIGFLSTLRFIALGLTLGALLVPPLALALLGASLASRGVRLLEDGAAGRAYPGLLAPRPAGDWPAATRMWGLAVFVGLFAASSTVLTLWATAAFQAPALRAVLLAGLQLGLLLACAAAGRAARAAARRLGRRLERLGRFNPLLGLGPAVALLVGAIALALLPLLVRHPNLRPLIPWRLGLAALAVAGGVAAGIALGRPRLRRRTLAAGAAVIYLGLAPLTLLWWGADPAAKSLAITSSPSLALLIDGVRKANDFDGDGYASLLGETDCAPFDSHIHPLAPEVPDNHIDENCDGRDLELARFEAAAGETPKVPPDFQRDWNFLLITIDTVRYDHTDMGGYPKRSGRDTTPKLAELAARAVSFSFCQSPSAGTMAVLPAILTSKYFHSGIALGPDRRGMPPITKPENLLLSEVLKAAGYQTGALVTHYYFNDWGLQQGFDTFDNSLGHKNNPDATSADRLTDHALSWIGKHAGSKWFLWTHYIDPHGHYVAHPGGPDWGSDEEALYDGELRFTDKHVGRLLQEMSRIPGVAENTIVIVTADHGDGFNEHGFTSHAVALYRELLNVPLIIYVPSVQPRVVPGPVSPLDIFPTVLDLAGIDRSRLSFEGRSLVPQLFYGKSDMDRVVFAETNYPKPQRAAISKRYKLIRRIQDNIYELYDLKSDPWEHKNIYRSNKPAAAMMRRHLDDWLERVYYARDRDHNQVMMKLADVLLARTPHPQHPIEGASFDDGRIQVLGFDARPASPAPGQTVEIAVYFRAKEPPSGDFEIQALAVPEGGTRVERSRAGFTAKGKFPTSRWRKGEMVRDRRRIRLYPKLEAGHLDIGLRLIGPHGQPLEPSGGATLEGGKALELGSIALSGAKGSSTAAAP